MSLETKKYHIAFSFIPEIGPIKFFRLQKHFSTLQEAWQAPLGELLKTGLDEKTCYEIIKKRNEINLDLEIEKLQKENVGVIALEDENYPKLLREIYNPPFLMYYKGKLKDERDEFSLSIVGTRKVSSYGEQVTIKLANELAQNQISIVSGMAVGVDSLAHKSCLEQNGRTIAVLGCGLLEKVIYPKANLRLFYEIIEKNGLVLSEYPLSTEPQRFFFPQRNRIVSGLSLGTLVVEAPLQSGALLTARHALEQNREVFAVPGNIYSKNSAGPNNLLKLGAKAVIEAQDILAALNLSKAKEFIEVKKISADSHEESLVLKYLSHEPLHIDDLTRMSGLNSAKINSTLTLMEMKGKVRNLGAMMYVLAR